MKSLGSVGLKELQSKKSSHEQLLCAISLQKTVWCGHAAVKEKMQQSKI